MNSKFNHISDVWAYLNSIPMFSKVGDKALNFGLENISRFCEIIGNPHTKFKSIHVAGTNGKGTTCYLLEAVYKKAGYKTGMFTSPHLLRFNERVRICGEEVEDIEILKFFQSSEKALEEIQLTFFEISTALAYWIFAQEEVDIAIIETGLGGRLDSTNIIHPELSIITSIGKDHELILGDTLEKIALEKAGIIKKNVPVIVGNLDEKVLEIIKSVAVEKESLLYQSKRLRPEYHQKIVRLSSINEMFKTKFLEPINAWNIAMVYQAIEVLSISYTVSKLTFNDAIEGFKGVPARFEKLHKHRDWYFSGAHNEQAIDAMIAGLNLIKKDKKVLVLSMMKDKVKTEILSRFNDFDQIYFYQQEGERAATFTDISSYICASKLDENNHEIILNELKSELVIFAGSFYFYSTLKRWLSN